MPSIKRIVNPQLMRTIATGRLRKSEANAKRIAEKRNAKRAEQVAAQADALFYKLSADIEALRKQPSSQEIRNQIKSAVRTWAQKANAYATAEQRVLEGTNPNTPAYKRLHRLRNKLGAIEGLLEMAEQDKLFEKGFTFKTLNIRLPRSR